MIIGLCCAAILALRIWLDMFLQDIDGTLFPQASEYTSDIDASLISIWYSLLPWYNFIH